MTLLETIDLVDAPYVVWVHRAEYFSPSEHKGLMRVLGKPFADYSGSLQIRIKPANPDNSAFRTEEIDMCLAVLPEGAQ